MHHLSKVAGKKDETSEKVTNVSTPIAVYKQRKILKEKNKLTNKSATNNKLVFSIQQLVFCKLTGL